MLSEGKFYWGTIRKAVVAFGNMFNKIHVDRRDDDGNVIQTLRIPLSYGPRNKFIARIEGQPNDPEQDFGVQLPRMAFEMTGVVYDPSRRVSLIQQNRAVNNTPSTLNAQYAPTPYNIDINLYIYSKNQDDALQVVEQILPYFNPDYNLSLKAIPALNIINDLPIILNNVSYEDNYEGDFVNRQSVIWTLSFTLKLNFYGPVSKQGFIKKVVANTYSDKELIDKQQTYTAEIVPNTANPGDVFDISETFEDF